MSAILILALTLAPKFFSPIENVTIKSSISLSGYKVTQIYNSFLTNYKSSYESDYNSTLNDYQMFINNDKNQTEILSNKMAEINFAWENFKTEVATAEKAKTDEEIANAKNSCLNSQNELRGKIISLENYYNELMQSLSSPLVLVTEQNDTNIQDNIGRAKSILAYSSSEKDVAYFKNIQILLENFNSLEKLEQNLSLIKNLDYSTEELNANFISIKKLADEKLPTALGKVTRLNADASLDAEFDANENNQNLMKNLIVRYLSACKNATELLSNDLMTILITNCGDTNISQYVGYENSNSYKFLESKCKYSYLLENDFADSDYASMLAFNKNSSQETNTFDYMYFALEIVSIAIITFTVILGAGMIAKEQSEGTIKLLAIRPYKRWKIILAKTFATLFFGLVFVLISAIVAFITGIIAYGISFPTMLVVFNANAVFTLPIWVVFLIYLASLLIKIWIYALLAIAISTIFNSYIASVCVAVGIYLANIVVTFVSKGATWLKYNIFSHIDLFKYFGGSFSTSFNSAQNLTSLFTSPVFQGTNFIVSIMVVVSMTIVLNIAIISVFNKKDIV